jgi:hypothetical protein
MADEKSWPSIERLGLLPAATLLQRWNDPAHLHDGALTEVRQKSLLLDHSTYGTAVVRDQKPLNSAALAESLLDLTVAEWLDELNSRSFFFLQRERLETLLNARSYRKQVNLVITIDTASLLQAHEAKIDLCRINSGFAQPHSKAPRGRDTFQPISAYDHPVRALPRTAPKWDVSELTVRGGVADLKSHTLKVDRMQGSTVLETIFEAT